MSTNITDTVEEPLLVTSYENAFFLKTEQKMFTFQDIKNLIFNPAAFFKSNLCLKMMFIYFVGLLIGMHHLIKRFPIELAKNQLLEYSSGSLYVASSQDWGLFWLYVYLGGVVSGSLYWFINGWWYNVRLKWCALEPINKLHGKTIFLYNTVIYTVFPILYCLVNTFLYPNYYEYNLSKGSVNVVFLSFALILWLVSIVNSYRSVKTIFDVNKISTIIWFLVLPTLYCVSLFFVNFLMF